MKFSCHSDTLHKALTQVSRAIANQTTVETLNYVYLSLSGSTLTLRGYNLTLGIESVITVDTESGASASDQESDQESGQVLVLLRPIQEVVRNFEKETLFFDCDASLQLRLTSDRFSFSLRGRSCDDYPVFPQLDTGISFFLNHTDLCHSLQQTLFAVSHDAAKKQLTGVMLTGESTQVSAMAADGFRLALQQYTTDDTLPDFSVILPAKSLQEYTKLVGKVPADTLTNITITDHQVQLSVLDSTLVTRLMTGEFPNHHNMTPVNPVYRFKVSRRHLLASCERAVIIASESNHVITLTLSDSTVDITAQAVNLGQFFETLPLICLTSDLADDDDSVSIAFNSRLILDGLTHIESDDVIIAFNSPSKACVMTPDANPDFKYILMPVIIDAPPPVAAL